MLSGVGCGAVRRDGERAVTGWRMFFGEYTGLADPATFARWLAPLRTCEWVV